MAYNESVKPEPLPEHNDPFRTEWTETGDRDYLTGEEVSGRVCITDFRH